MAGAADLTSCGPGPPAPLPHWGKTRRYRGPSHALPATPAHVPALTHPPPPPTRPFPVFEAAPPPETGGHRIPPPLPHAQGGTVHIKQRLPKVKIRQQSPFCG